jgi:hypothetical protein
MEKSTSDRAAHQTNCGPFAPFSFGADVMSLLPFLLAGLVVLSACGGGSSNQSQSSGALAGNWQFTMAAPSDNSFQGGIQGGFLLQNNGTVTGAVVYEILLLAQQGGPTTLCNSGSAPITGTVSGQNITLTATAGTQSFTLTGTLSADNSTMMGTYTSTDGQGCGTAQTGLRWSATSVPPLTGTVQGSFHSIFDPSLKNQDFQVTGTLTQGQNIGASSATVTGTLSFQGYPCLPGASVNGQISGNSVILQIIAPNGLNVGQIGAPVGSSRPYPAPVTVVSSTSGVVLQGPNGYGVTTSSCPGGNLNGDGGNLCLALGSSTSCTQPITLSPPSIIFPAQLVGSVPTTQTITLTNSAPSATPLTGLSLSFNPQSGNTSEFPGFSDFDGLPNFTEQDNCANPAGSAFALAPQQSCLIAISFSPQQSCPWLPSTALGGEPPVVCPFPLVATLTVNSPVSADSNTAFAVPITGTGFSALVPSTPELDFGAEAVGGASLPQLVSFTNQGASPVQILPALTCVNPLVGQLTLPRPAVPGEIAGLLVDIGSSITQFHSTIKYNCDSDLTSKQPNLQIFVDDCSGMLLPPQASCSIEVTFAPQPSTALTSGLDYFLELNTLQCTSTTTSNCEIDSGRFPVELRANVPSPLRMSPGAGLDFGIVPKGQASTPLTVTLFNDPSDPNSSTINFTGNLVQGNFSETDNCVGTSLAPGNSCMITVTFKSKTVGLNSGTITIGYTVGQTQIIYLRGTVQ